LFILLLLERRLAKLSFGDHSSEIRKQQQRVRPRSQLLFLYYYYFFLAAVTMKVSGDPYKTLGVSHDASTLDIKRSYRALARKYHPDKWVQCTDDSQRDAATHQFAKIADAYALLSDPQLKAQYDHIYKYGGFDEAEEEEEKLRNTVFAKSDPQTTSTSTSTTTTTRRKRKSHERGIGYTCYDPLAFLWTHGEIHARRTVAGIHIPSRFHNNPSAAAAGFRFAFSSGEVCMSPTGTKKCVSQTTQFANGKKQTVKETVIYHPDGRKEVVIEGDDATTHRYYSTHSNISKPNEMPWYIHAWQEIRDKLSMCYNPCAVTQ
jgi:DnaJ-domain-containing protein 1